MKICRENGNLVKIGYKYRALCKKAEVCFVVTVETNSPQKRSLRFRIAYEVKASPQRATMLRYKYIVYILAFRASLRNISRRISSPLSVEDNPDICYSHKGLSCLHQKLWPCLLSLNLTDFHLELYCIFLCWSWTFELDKQIVMRRTAIQTRRKRDIRVSLALAFHKKYDPSFSFEAYCFADLRRSTHLFIITLASTSLHETNIFDIKHAN
jgi:hypothetical protein